MVGKHVSPPENGSGHKKKTGWVIAIVAALLLAAAGGLCYYANTYTGVFPGGMGNLKMPITRATVGVPVIGIGVPTVIDSRLFGARKDLLHQQCVLAYGFK